MQSKDLRNFAVQAVSDLHGNLIDVEPCDILCICGDISPLEIQRDHLQMWKWVWDVFVPWVQELPVDKVFFTPGNHDFWFQKFITENIKKTLCFATEQKLHILIDEEYVWKGIKIYGTPWIPPIGRLESWAYQAYDVVREETFEQIPDDVDFLISHSAPAIGGIGRVHDRDGNAWEDFGDVPLAHAITKKKPKYVFCGHVHTGTHHLVDTTFTKIANVSYLDEEYKAGTYKPLELTITQKDNELI